MIDGRVARVALVAFGATGVLVASHPGARAETVAREIVSPRARELAADGRRRHDAGDYLAAIAAFEQAYALAPSPALLFNLAQAQRLAGHCDDAARLYRRFLDEAPAGPPRELAARQLANVERCDAGRVRITLTPPSLDLVVPVPRDAPSALRAPSDAPRIASPLPGATLRRAGAWTIAGGGASLAAALVLALDARAAARSVEDAYRAGTERDQLAGLDARGARAAATARVLAAGGAAAVLAGATLHALGRARDARQIAVTPSRGGAEVQVSWGF